MWGSWPMLSLTLFFNGLFHAYSSFFYPFHSWALYLATILLYFVLPYSQAPALVLYSSYISVCTYTVHTLYLVSRDINASLWHLSGFPCLLVLWSMVLPPILSTVPITLCASEYLTMFYRLPTGMLTQCMDGFRLLTQPTWHCCLVFMGSYKRHCGGILTIDLELLFSSWLPCSFWHILSQTILKVVLGKVTHAFEVNIFSLPARRSEGIAQVNKRETIINIEMVQYDDWWFWGQPSWWWDTMHPAYSGFFQSIQHCSLKSLSHLEDVTVWWLLRCALLLEKAVMSSTYS